jgi:hypothetical protein
MRGVSKAKGEIKIEWEYGSVGVWGYGGMGEMQNLFLPYSHTPTLPHSYTSHHYAV